MTALRGRRPGGTPSPVGGRVGRVGRAIPHPEPGTTRHHHPPTPPAGGTPTPHPHYKLPYFLGFDNGAVGNCAVGRTLEVAP